MLRLFSVVTSADTNNALSTEPKSRYLLVKPDSKDIDSNKRPYNAVIEEIAINSIYNANDKEPKTVDYKGSHKAIVRVISDEIPLDLPMNTRFDLISNGSLAGTGWVTREPIHYKLDTYSYHPNISGISIQFTQSLKDERPKVWSEHATYIDYDAYPVIHQCVSDISPDYIPGYEFCFQDDQLIDLANKLNTLYSTLSSINSGSSLISHFENNEYGQSFIGSFVAALDMDTRVNTDALINAKLSMSEDWRWIREKLLTLTKDIEDLANSTIKQNLSLWVMEP